MAQKNIALSKRASGKCAINEQWIFSSCTSRREIQKEAGKRVKYLTRGDQW